MKLDKRKKYIILSLVALVLLISASYAIFTEILIGEKHYKLTSEGLKLYLDETNISNSIELADAVPVKDEVGLQNEPYNFSLANNEEEDLSYSIYLVEEEIKNITPASAIRYNYTRDIDNINVTKNIEEIKKEDSKYCLESGTIPSKQTYNYTFRMWIDYDAGNEIMGTSYSVHLEIDATQTTTGVYADAILNGTDPVLTDNLVPVILKDNGTVTKASLYEEWYKYEEQRWANAVVLVDNTINYNVGDTIPESNIESYFVWIPRYKYQIFNKGSYTSLSTLKEDAVQTINVEFESKNVEPTTGSAVGDWHSHPAFQAFDSNGFWVGKFESGYNGATSEAKAQVNIIEPNKLIIKPNVYSWRGITLGNGFKTVYDYMRNEDSHLMKNTEWGAVAYLQHSLYGSRQSVRINNNSDYKTGYAATEEPTCGNTDETSTDCNLIGTSTSVTRAYNTPIGYLASTTANITGIYDMSGGSYEYVMGYTTAATTIGASSEINYIYGDFFSGTNWEKYYDKYTSNSASAYNKRILGDATGEMGPFESFTNPDKTKYSRCSWYEDNLTAIWDTEPWIDRGGYWGDGVGSGIFSTDQYSGETYHASSFRVVLTPKGDSE